MTPEEIISFPAGFPLKLYACDIDSNTPHWHKELEIIYLLDGQLDVFIEDKHHVFKAGEFMVINPKKIHYFKRASQTNRTIVLQTNPKIIEYFSPEIHDLQFQFSSFSATPEQRDYFVTTIYDIITSLHDQKPVYTLEVLLKLAELLIFLVREPGTAAIATKANRISERLIQITTFIDEHFHKKITLEDLADQVQLSPTYISHLFSKNMGMTFQHYLKMKRLNFAYSQLIQTDAKVIEIALSAGFSDAQTFANFFKREFQATPSQVRKQNKDFASHVPVFNHAEEQLISLYNSIPLSEMLTYFSC